MGINIHYYTVYGVKIEGYSEDFAEAWDEKYYVVEKLDNVAIIAGGYDVSYVVIGKILFDSGDLRYNGIEDTFVTIDNTGLNGYKENATKAFLDHFPEFSGYMENEWNLMTFAHYS